MKRFYQPGAKKENHKGLKIARDRVSVQQKRIAEQQQEMIKEKKYLEERGQLTSPKLRDLVKYIAHLEEELRKLKHVRDYKQLRPKVIRK